MSTEIKSTLFRFVTMRAPEFVEQSEVNKNHVVFPSDLENNNIFISAVRNLLTTGDREAALKDILKNFVPIKNREQLIDIEGNVNLYEFSIWLTKNRNALKKDEILDYINNIGVSPLSNIEEIWNNLFYQILTSESNYVRDGLLSLLVGHNFITNHLNIPQTDKDFKKLAQAKVIVPKELFVKANMTNAVNDKNNIINGLPKSTTHLEKKLEVVVQKQYLENLNSTLDELKLYQNKLNRKASKQFEIDKKAYDENIKTLTENTTPNRQTFTDKEIGVDRTFTDFDNLKLPNFEPTLYPELDITDIENNVSNQTFIIADAVINSSEPNTLTELNQTIAQEISQTTSTIFNNTIAQQSNVQMINGVIIPENTDIEGDTLLFYADNFAGNPFNNVMAVFNTNIDNAQVVQASYKIKIGTAAFQNFTESNGLINFSIDNNKLTVKFNPTGLILTLNSTITINGTLTISNGDQILFNAIGVVKTKAGNRFLNLTLNAVGTFSTTKASIQAGIKSTIKIKPSEFGINRLGIADYRKVEQEVCCYVPGEVSHIENIMASEYKEKATRVLRRSEDTLTVVEEKESEKLSDTTSTERFEMNQEVASVIAEDTQMASTNSFSTSYGKSTLQTGLNFANNTSQEQSNSQAVTFAKDITERALDRVVVKTKKERVTKIIEEYEENNKHGFDNRNNPNHVSGVYRWVDKVYDNKVINYGKRLMYEFMIPEPAKFHTIAKNTNLEAFSLQKPIDPRTFNDSLLKLDNYSKVNETTYSHWATLLGAEVEPKPADAVTVSENISVAKSTIADFTFAKDLKIIVPEGYVTQTAQLFLGESTGYGNNPYARHFISLGAHNLGHFASFISINTVEFPFKNYKTEVTASYHATSIHSGSGSVKVNCILTAKALKEWQIKTFNAIIAAYDKKLKEYNLALTEYNNNLIVKNRTNPLFNRQIENTVLRKNCIEYLVSQEAIGSVTLTTGNTTQDFSANYTSETNQTYGEIVKFFEQAFEWDIMSYYFYPFYWGNKSNWSDLYNVNESVDPLFKSFLQSGMARVIVTVRPGFEEAVNWYLATGEIWNGGEVPTLNDPLFISIVEELKQPEGEVEETWKSRVPTSLTIIQAGALGLEVTQALPCDDDCKDYRQFDSDGNVVNGPDGKPINTNPFKKTEATLQGVQNKPNETPEPTPIIPPRPTNPNGGLGVPVEL